MFSACSLYLSRSFVLSMFSYLSRSFVIIAILYLDLIGGLSIIIYNFTWTEGFLVLSYPSYVQRVPQPKPVKPSQFSQAALFALIKFHFFLSPFSTPFCFLFLLSTDFKLQFFLQTKHLKPSQCPIHFCPGCFLHFFNFNFWPFLLLFLIHFSSSRSPTVEEVLMVRVAGSGLNCVTRAPLLYFIRSWVALSFKVCQSVSEWVRHQ